MNELQTKDKLATIYSFLLENREYNKALQTRYYESILLSRNTAEEKTISLLYHVANTQSKPKIDNLATFYKSLSYDNYFPLKSFKNFLIHLSKPSVPINNFNNLFVNLKKQKGYGEKTAALFVKSIHHIHLGDYPNKLRIWDDVPFLNEECDRLYLPVDAVILFIFKFISNKNWNFNNINDEISKYYSGIEIEAWDDLWFWGFITQKGSTTRAMEWNENKYWSLLDTDKDEKIITEIRSKAIEFIQILHALKDDNMPTTLPLQQ
jgi:hypothetical protein